MDIKIRNVRSFCKQIDLLAPAHYGVDKQNLTNCEYPWEVTDVNGQNPRAYAPCEYNFEIFKDEYMTLTPRVLEIVEREKKLIRTIDWCGGLRIWMQQWFVDNPHFLSCLYGS